MFRILCKALLTVSLLAAYGFSMDPDHIIFPHDLHITDVELSCDYCHSGVSDSESLTPGYLPDMDFCSECHDVEDECELCHSNVDEADTYPLMGSTSGVDFSHAAHRPSTPNCETCHSGITSDDGEALRQPWPRAACSQCHQSHEPASHDITWDEDHGLSVNHPQAASCSMCHTEKFCDDCHHHSGFEKSTHPPAYIVAHGLEARLDAVECMTCHQIENDCQSCHIQRMIMPADHNLTTWGIINGNAGMHADAAESTPEVCQSCHQPHYCQRCHGG